MPSVVFLIVIMPSVVMLSVVVLKFCYRYQITTVSTDRECVIFKTSLGPFFRTQWEIIEGAWDKKSYWIFCCFCCKTFFALTCYMLDTSMT
jgi:hypothetical protein